MITIRKSAERGHANHGWLDSYHTFSFASYHDPAFMGFSELRVINQDWVAPGKGFGTHGHENMEIVSYVLDGVLEHKDNMGSGSQMRSGDVQLMSAGTGVTHSEFNASDSDSMAFLQIWVIPKEQDTQPRYEQKEFPDSTRLDQLRLIVSPDGRDGSLTIGQDVNMYASLLDKGEVVAHEVSGGRKLWVHVARGALTLNGQALASGDGARIEDETLLTFEGGERAEFLLFELPG